MDFWKQHYMPRGAEILFGVVFSIIGLWLLWCAFDNRGKEMIWPFSGLMPW